jgi:hypothetical protein
MKDAAEVLEELGVSYELSVVSAHRTPLRMVEYATEARKKGLKVIIAGAGGAAHLKNDLKPKPVREIFNWVNPKTKEVKLPADFAGHLKKHKKQSDFFNTLSFTNKKEYIEWIVTAKREQTRKDRIDGSIDRLGKEWKNPANI